MTPQQSVWILTLVFLGLCAFVFMFAIGGGGRFSSTAAEQGARRGWELFRVLAFSGMVIALVFVSFFTLVRFPVPPQHGVLEADEVVRAVGRQWSWALSKDEVTAGGRVEFDVTSADVNHGFAIYDRNGDLIAQTQAMPGVTNRLLVTFVRPGTYSVLCLEYCGLGHAQMRAEIQVVDGAGKGE